MLKNTFIKVNNHSHGNRIVESFLKLGAKNSRDLIKGCVGQYVGVITDTLTCIPAKDLLTLKGTITITNLEEIESKYKNAYKPKPIEEGMTKSNIKSSGQIGRQSPPPPPIKTDRYKEGFADGFRVGFEISK